MPAVEATDGDGSWMGTPGRYVNLTPTIAAGALLSLLGTPSFALSPQEATRLRLTVCAWRDHDKAMTALLAEMEQALTNEQGAEVSRRRQSAQERMRAIYAFHVLEALGEVPQGTTSSAR